MKLRITEFSSCKDILIEHYTEKGLEDVQLVCVLCGIPLIAAYSYIQEGFPDDELLQKEMDDICKFYGYTEIVKQHI